ncbi:winged-helix domain-containing protein [Proteinivorax tanatarense]|uniref:Winged-helix domain-containing protein n=1 Tax=Proteinivorax tanatarense TaxID=1260629 RepID=A0AAU7VIH5_9FIRM
MAKKVLSAKRKALLKLIHSYIEEHGYSPSVRELTKLLNVVSTSSVHNHLRILEDNDFISKHGNSPRTLSLTDKGREVI